MGLTVTTANTSGIKLTVGVNNGGMQGSTYNPQQTAPSTVLQNPKPVQYYQPAATISTYQNAANAAAIQRAAQAAQIQAAAEAARRAAEAEAERIRQELARIKEENRKRVQGELDTKVAEAKNGLTLTIGKAVMPRLRGVSVAKSAARIKIPELSEYDKQKLKAYYDAMAEIDKQRQSNKKGLSKLWDKVTFGQERRDADAREAAKRALEEMSKSKVSDFEKNINAFLAEQAKRKASIESSKFDSQEAFDKTVGDYDAWQKSKIAEFQRGMAQLEGSSEAYDTASKRGSDTKIAHAFGVAQKLSQATGFSTILKYTIGGGGKNLPSIVTTPSRVVNFFGNLNTQDRNIYQTGGGSTKRGDSSILSAWQSTQNQRNFNIRPYVDQPYTKAAAEKKFGALADSYIKAQHDIGQTDPRKLNRDLFLKRQWDGMNGNNRGQNSLLEFVADPLIAVGPAARGARSLGMISKVGDVLKETKIGSKIIESAQNSKAAKVLDWLGQERKSPTQIISEQLDTAKKAQSAIQDKYIQRINELNHKILGPNKMPDTRILDELTKITDAEAGMLQRSKNGQLAIRDRLILAGQKTARARIEDLARRTTEWTEQMKIADVVEHTRYGAGKRFYAPRTNWLTEKGEDLDSYNFRIRKKRYPTQSAADLHRSFVDRYFKSDIDALHVETETAKKSRRIAERDQLVQRYDAELDPYKKSIESLRSKHSTALKLSKLNPMNLWRKSVLQYRPAWYVNNIGYNLQASVLAGGLEAIPESLKLLRPKNYAKAIADLPNDLQTDIAKQIGRGPLSRLSSRVENVSRIGAYKSLINKGYDGEKALKRVNRYLFDYSTKNWERPLRAAMPFWSFQKNVAKASIVMPFDRPVAAIGYNRLQDYQDKQFNDDFAKIVPGLLKAGYTEDEIQKIKDENYKYAGGRLKINGRYYSTPFNAFSEKAASNNSINPIFESVAEWLTAKDHFGRQLSGNDGSLLSRFISKVPQLQIAKEGKAKFWDNLRDMPSEYWIGAAGSEGYGMTKSAQGYDPTKPNYKKSLDKGANFGADVSAFLGKPRSIELDTSTILQRKVMQKLKDEYFGIDWNAQYPDFAARSKAQADLFKKYGVSADDFYNGELAKYDTPNTMRIKTMKEAARAKSSALFDEYGKQPVGTRKVWATQKLKELVDTGYFDKNPFLSSFDWLKPDLIQSAQKTIAYRQAKASGDWSLYESKYGDNRKHSPFTYDGKFFKTAESRDRYIAGQKNRPAAEFWKSYAAADPLTRRQMIKDHPEYSHFPTKSPEQSAEAKFWQSYAAADTSTRRKLIADNPQYNHRAGWTDQMWDDWRASTKAELQKRARSITTFATNETSNRLINEILARHVTEKAKTRPLVKIRLR